ncbi:pyruvate dehydrogenase E1 component beta subunit [Methanocella paludicola SANAE]|uniref:Pyruvate dehydrogenase E1 component beta subunit n=1 Tax=Methanocella paludicola (strain DSM 17711 / JCM 13418 / NBRC 101707 / SANAE) TaxID=304371 RepID=D1YZB8_METPS|nr:alpha-ketoacid dehydrogenase subunit beta [Methanocella paludicola]BAI61790.1 pyruvate dehydrogenase E1 component beta subunit [Methanocella paludicola SANAE]
MMMNNVQAVNDALMYEMGRDPTVMMMGEDVGREGGVFRATTGLQQKYGKARVVDTPLSENGIVGTAVGLALNGMKPVAEIQFSGFVFAAYDQLISHASRMRQRSMGRYHVPMVVRMPFGGGVRALEHHSESDETIYTQIPGLKVVAACTPTDMKGLLISAIRDPDPIIFLEHIRLYRAFREEVPEGEFTLPIGKARVALQGNDLTILAWGAMVNVSLEAAKQLQKEGINAEVIDLRTLKPLDKEAVLNSVKRTGRVVIVEEAHRISGFGSDLGAIIAEDAMLYLKAPIIRVSGYDIRFPLYKLEDEYLPDPHRVAVAAKEVMNF